MGSPELKRERACRKIPLSQRPLQAFNRTPGSKSQFAHQWERRGLPPQVRKGKTSMTCGLELAGMTSTKEGLRCQQNGFLKDTERPQWHLTDLERSHRVRRYDAGGALGRGSLKCLRAPLLLGKVGGW